MSYKIEITKKEIKEMPAGKEWERTGKKDGDGGGEYAYTPEILKKKEVETVLLRQTLDDLDMPAVIKAINKL